MEPHEFLLLSVSELPSEKPPFWKGFRGGGGDGEQKVVAIQ